MGNRTSIYSVSRDRTDGFMVFEANNNLPFFWILLLDSKTIMQNKDELIRSFYEDEERQSIKLSSETLAKNINTSTRYLERYSAELLPKFIEFGNYILNMTKESSIEIDLLDMANFTSAEEFVDKLVFDLKKVENQERLDELLALNKADFLELVGYEDMVYLPKSFSKFSTEYRILREDIQKKYELEKQQGKIIYEKEKRKERHRRFFMDILFMGLVGLVFFTAGIAIIVKEELSFLAVTGVIMGLLSMLYSYFKFKNII